MKNKIDYSLKGIQNRQIAAREAYIAAHPKPEEQIQKEEPKGPVLNPPAGEHGAIGSGTYTPYVPPVSFPLPQKQIVPAPANTPIVPKKFQEWDYKGKVGPKGETLPPNAIGWTPDGNPYFGPGFSGTLKKYWYNLTGEAYDKPDPAEVDQARQSLIKSAEEQKKYIEALKKGDKAAIQEHGLATMKASGAGFVGYMKNTFNWLADGFEPDPNASKEQKAIINAASPLTGVLRLSKVGLMALGDVFGESAVKVEQSIGAVQAMEEEVGVNKAREALNDAMDRTKLNDKAQSAVNLLLSIAPPFALETTIKFMLSNKTTEEKMEIVGSGFDAGRILYTGVWDSAKMEQFKIRAKAGEDPQLLAMELQNPWAEMTGQLILDPLNLIGAVAKTAKTTGVAMDAVSATTKAGDEMLQLAKAGLNITDDALAIKVMKEQMIPLQKASVAAIKDANLTQKYTAKAFTVAGNIQRVRRDAEQFIMLGVSNMIQNSKSVEDIADWLRHGVMSVSDNVDEIQEGITGLLNTPSPRMMFSDEAKQTFLVMRNVLLDEQGVVDVSKLLDKLKATSGQTDKLITEVFVPLTEKAVHRNFPTFTEMRLAAEKTGDLDKKTQALKDAYNTFSEGQKQTMKWAEVAVTGKNWVNKQLGFFYFNQYGFATRNMMNNFVTTMVDVGPKAFFKPAAEWKLSNPLNFWSMQNVEEYIKQWHGGIIPAFAAGPTQVQDATNLSKFLPDALAGTIGKVIDKYGPAAVAHRAEQGAALRIYANKFRETIDMMYQPGKLLPTTDEFRAAGISEGELQHFIFSLKHNGGDINKTVAQVFNGKKEAWKLFESYTDPQILAGAKELGILDSLKAFSQEEHSAAEISKFFDDAIETQRKLAQQSAETAIPHINPNETEVINTFRAVDPEDINPGAAEKLNEIMNASDAAHDEYFNKLVEANRKASANPEYSTSALAQEYDALIKDMNSKSGTGAIAKRLVSDKTKKTWDAYRDAKTGKADLKRAWELLGIEKPYPKTGMSVRDFSKAIWEAQEKFAQDTWDAHFDQFFQSSIDIANQFEQFVPGTMQSFDDARRLSDRLQMVRAAEYSRGRPTMVISDAAAGVQDIWKQYRDDKFGDNHVINFINKYLADAPGTPKDIEKQLNTLSAQIKATTDEAQLAELNRQYAELAIQGGTAELKKVKSIKDVTPQMMRDALEKAGHTRKGDATVTLPMTMVTSGGPTITPDQMWVQVADGSVGALQKLKQQVLSKYGTYADGFEPSKAQAVADMLGKYGTAAKMGDANMIAGKVGKYWRDFSLLPYGETKNMDLMMSFVYPYQFWYKGTYTNWMKRVASDPQVVANYFKLKEAMSQSHKDAPEWFKYNVQVPDFLGLNGGHPMIMNLEANLNPLNGLTGVDFNDPYKRVDWMTALVDDMGKFGPSVWAPINMAIAAGLSLKGQQDAASRWGGRLIPQTAAIKAGASYFDKNLELDPSVQIFSGKGLTDTKASDPYERNRIGRALSALVEEGKYTQEQALEASRTQEGPIWEEAQLRATQLRAAGQISSFFLGVGFKARNEQDIQIDEFYTDYSYINNQLKGKMISPDQYRQSIDQLRDKYPFMDTLLLSKKAGPDREKAFAYSTLGRIPPGELTDIAKFVKVEPYMLDAFYANGGDLSSLTPQDRERFNSAIVDIAAMLKMPNGATKTEWNTAKAMYADMNEMLQRQYGEQIQDQISKYFTLDSADKDLYLQTFPDVELALQAQTNMVTNTPLLATYYGGIDTVSRYYSNAMYDQLDKEFGKDIQDKVDQYYWLRDNVSDKDAKMYYEAEGLKAYNKRRAQLQQEMNIAASKAASNIPDRMDYTIRPEFQPASGIQEQTLNYTTVDQEAANAQAIWEQMSEPTKALVEDYFNGEDLPYAVEQRIKSMGDKYGMSVEQTLRLLGMQVVQ